MWGIQDSLLQSYRGIFITAESVVIAIAASVTTSNPWSAIFLNALGLALLCMWHRVCFNRALDVTFVQWLMARAEEGTNVSAPFKAFKDFQAGHTITVAGQSVQRNASNDSLRTSMRHSATRQWMEVRLPIAFLILWGATTYMAVYELSK